MQKQARDNALMSAYANARANTVVHLRVAGLDDNRLRVSGIRNWLGQRSPCAVIYDPGPTKLVSAYIYDGKGRGRRRMQMHLI